MIHDPSNGALIRFRIKILTTLVTILTNFVIVDMPEDDNMSIILGRPFLNTTRAVINCNKSKVSFHVNGKQHTVHFPKKQVLVNHINVLEPCAMVIIGDFKIPLSTLKKRYFTLIVGDMQIPIGEPSDI